MALRPCRECKKEISDRAKNCPHCGIKHPAYTWTFGRTFFAVLFGGGILAMIITGALSSGTPPDPLLAAAEQRENRRYEAQSHCLDVVRTRLKAPSTAKFVEKRTVQAHGQWLFMTTGQVDAENSFGAMLRNDFMCSIALDTVTNRWQIKSVVVR